ncbi:MAG: hypothetical protein WD766_08220 [Gemmatimonadota bacterium]
MKYRRPARHIVLALGITAAGCGGSPGSGPSPAMPADYAALPDTLVCVVDRAAPSGLSELPAKLDGDEVVVFADGAVRPLDELHPVNMIAGYAGREGWLTRGEPVTFQGRQYVRTGGERRIGIDLLSRVGEHQGILVFAGQEDDAPADAIYVPTAPGCIFQAFVREDLLRQ